MAIDIIGPLHDVDMTSPENPVVTTLDGWHVNSTEVIPSLDAYRVQPSKPRQSFLGWTQPPVCYWFESEQQCMHVLAAAGLLSHD